MAKNTGASKFRKVNVDEYDEENFQDNEDSDVGVVGPNENEVTNFLNQCILLQLFYQEGNFLPQVAVPMNEMNATFPLVTNELFKKNVLTFVYFTYYLDI